MKRETTREKLAGVLLRDLGVSVHPKCIQRNFDTSTQAAGPKFYVANKIYDMWCYSSTMSECVQHGVVWTDKTYQEFEANV